MMAFLFGRNNNNNKEHQRDPTTNIVDVTAASTATNSTTIQDNIVRVQTFNHVSDKYDVIEMIGKGSMGAIYKVRIKPNKLGGSAFYPNVPVSTTTTSTTTVNHTTTMNNTKKLSFTSRFKGRLSKGIRHSKMMSLPATTSTSTTTTTTGTNNSSTTSSSCTNTVPPPPHYDDDVMNRHVYALKTIRLDSINDMVDDDMIKTFLDEMINEMNILRSMDHPNIIKAHEIFMTKPPQLVPTTTTTTKSSSSSSSNKNKNKNKTKQSNTTTTVLKQQQMKDTKSTEFDDDNELLQHQHMCIALELCTGGNLYSRAPYQEMEAAYIIEQMLNAARYMHHQRGIVHRDMKFENILFVSDDFSSYHIKILDFGLSKQFKHKKIGYMYERVGTIYTMAPEVLIDDDNVPYTAQAEVWSIGIIAYMLLCKDNTRPFYHTDFHTMVDLIQEGNVNYDSPIWDKSDTAKDFVQHLLQVNPYQRYTIVQALQHPFIQQRDRTIHEMPSPQIYKSIESSIQQYSQKDTTILKKLALSIIAHDSTMNKKYTTQNNNNHSTIDQLQKAFTQFDTEKNGILSYDEFKTAILQTMSHEEQDGEESDGGHDRTKEDANTNENSDDCLKHSASNESSKSIPYTEQELERIFASLVGGFF